MKLLNVVLEPNSIYQPVRGAVVNRTVDTEVMTISCYENEIPVFVEAELSRIYGNLYSSLHKFRSDGNASVSSTYAVDMGGGLITVFLFCQDGGKVRVLNEVIRIDEEDILRFSSYIFSHFSSATAISFNSIHSNLEKATFPYQRINVSEDIVLMLPDNVDDYLSSLGKNMRRKIRRFSKKLLVTFPLFQFEIFEKDEISPQTIRDIIYLNRERMVGKEKISDIDEKQTELTIHMAKKCGLICVARIDGKVCAGSISFQAGSNYFFSVIAHDSNYDSYCLGYLCSYRFICECIARKGNEFHFLWGEYDYKYSLLGVKRELDKIVIYRSHVYFLLNAGLVLRTAFEGWIRQAILRLHKVKSQNNPASLYVVASLKFVRRLSRFRPGILARSKDRFLGQSQEK